MTQKLQQIKKNNQNKLSKSLGKQDLPLGIKEISVSLFVFTLGWGLGGDTFFSVYVNSIVPSALGVTLIGAFLAFIKLLFVIPVGIMNDKGSTRYLLLLGKIVYALSGFFYFLAGFYGSFIWLLFAIFCNGIGNSSMHTSYRTVYGDKASKDNRTKVFGVYFSSSHLALVIGALIASFFVNYVALPYLYLFITIFALLSLLQDEKIQEFFKQKFNPEDVDDAQIETSEFGIQEFDEGMDNVRKLFGSRGVIILLFKELFSFAPWKKVFVAIKGYGMPMYTVLANQSLVSMISYINFLFIPLVAMENHLSLSQIAILFAVMKAPYLINIVIGSLGDKYSKKLITGIVLSVIAVAFFFLGSVSSFSLIIFFSFIGALGVAILNPIASSLIGGYAKAKDKGIMAALQEFTSKIGEILGSLGFGVVASIIGMDTTFIVAGIGLFVLGIWISSKKLIRIKTQDHEAHKELEAVQPYFKKK